MTTTVEESVTVSVPLHTAYNQWTQFEEFPQFMEGVESVRQLDDTHLHWKADIGGVHREWDAKISEQRPDERVAWTSIDGARNAGAVTVHRIDPETTKVMLQLEFDPDGIAEKVADKLGFVRRRATGDLERFKQFVEERGVESGAWRGEVDPPPTV